MTPPYSEKVIDLGFAEIITRHRLQVIDYRRNQLTNPNNAISPGSSFGVAVTTRAKGEGRLIHVSPQIINEGRN